MKYIIVPIAVYVHGEKFRDVVILSWWLLQGSLKIMLLLLVAVISSTCDCKNRPVCSDVLRFLRFAIIIVSILKLGLIPIFNKQRIYQLYPQSRQKSKQDI